MASFVKSDQSTAAEAVEDKGKNEEGKEDRAIDDDEEEEEDEDSAEAEAERLCRGKEEDGKEYLVVVETYPTTTGCYSGMRWSELDLHRRTDVETFGPFPSYRDALVDAIERRNRNERFGELSYSFGNIPFMYR